VTLKEYEEKLNQSKKLAVEELKDIGENEFISIIYHQRDDMRNKSNLCTVVANYDGVLEWIRFVTEELCFKPNDEPIENCIYFKAEKWIKAKDSVKRLVCKSQL